MITDKHLLIIALISSTIGLIGLIIFPAQEDSELETITIEAVYEANNGYIIDFFFKKSFKAYSKENLTIGEYQVLLERGGNDFYYIGGLQKVNGSN